jgi:hypothetical protein
MAQPILLTTETACNAIAQSCNVSAYEGFLSTVNFYTGIYNETKSAPCVICAATEAMPEPQDCPNLGNYIVRASIIVKERATKANRETTTLADTIFRGFLTGSIAQNLISNAPNYFVHNAWVENHLSGVEGKMWVETLNLNIMCCLTQ